MKEQPPERTAALPTIAIVGRPNVGKSSLFNSILKRRHAIVHFDSGVTRDRVSSTGLFEGRRFRLVDTGGLGMGKGEKRGVDFWDRSIEKQVEVAIEDADVIFFVVDVTSGLTGLDEEAADSLDVVELFQDDRATEDADELRRQLAQEQEVRADALDRVDRTMEFLKSREIFVDRRFLIWCQGETDADHMVSAEEYIRRTEKIIQGFLEHGIGKCFLVQIGHYNDPAPAGDGGEVAGEETDQYYRVIRDAQLRLCLDRKEVVLAASFEPYLHEMKDRFHYRQEAYNEVGLHVGRKLARSQYR